MTEFAKWMKARGYTHQMACRAFGVTRRTIDNWLDGVGPRGNRMVPSPPARALMAAIDDGFDVFAFRGREAARERRAA